MPTGKWKGRKGSRFHQAWAWDARDGTFIADVVREHPLINICSGTSFFGDLRVDAYTPYPTVRADAAHLPFRSDSFAAAFIDPPWNAAFMKRTTDFIHEALRVAPIAYVLCPWTWGSSRAHPTAVFVRWLPGLNPPLLLTRYERVAEGSADPIGGRGRR